MISLILIASFAIAEDAPPASVEGPAVLVPPVVVTASGNEENYLEVPSRIDRVSKTDLKREKIRFVGEALNRIPGVFTREMNPLIPAIGIRTPANTNSPYWLATHDSIPLIPSISYSHESASRMFFASGAGDYEVLKGPSSVLYGSDAITGVVNLKSPNPGEKPEHGVGIEAGERGFGRFKINSSQMVSDTDGYAAFANYAVDKGWRDGQQSQRAETLVRHVRKMASGAALTTTALANNRYSTEAGYLTKSDYDNNPTKSGNTTTEDFYRKNTYIRLTSEYKKSMDEGKTLSVTPYFRFDDYRILEYWNTTLPGSKSLTKSLGVRTIYNIEKEASESVMGFEIEGTDYSKSREQTMATVPGSGGDPTKDVPRGVQYDYQVNYFTFSPFANQSWFISKDWRIDLGARATYSTYDYKNRAAEGGCDSTNNTNGACGVFYRPGDRIDTFNNISPKFGLSYQLSPLSSLFFNTGYGFKIPGASSLYEIKVTEKAASLKPEKAFSAEIGYKYNSNQYGVDLSVYHLEISDRITKTQGVASELASAVNAGKSQTQGVELGARAGLGYGLTFLGGASVSASKYVDYQTGGVDYSGKYESFAPTQVSNVRLRYQPKMPLWLEFEWRKNNGFWVEDANSNFESGFDLFNFRAEYSFGNWKLNMKVFNLTDVKYAADVANFGSLRYRPGMPKTFYVGLDYQF